MDDMELCLEITSPLGAGMTRIEPLSLLEFEKSRNYFPAWCGDDQPEYLDLGHDEMSRNYFPAWCGDDKIKGNNSTVVGESLEITSPLGAGMTEVARFASFAIADARKVSKLLPRLVRG